MLPSARRLASLLLVLCAATTLAAKAEVPPAGPAEGAPAPAFRLQDQAGRWHALEEYRGHWLVVYFYPKDQTPGCTTQACSLRDNIFAFRKADATIVGISVDDVARLTALSRRSLADRFMHSLHRTIAEEIHGARIDRIKKLLAMSDISVTQIARDLGYMDDKHFARYFHRHCGMTPRDYRKKHAPA